MICYYDPNGVPTDCESIAEWQRLSRFPIEIVNLWPGRNSPAHQLPATLNLACYAGIVIHRTVASSAADLAVLDQELNPSFEAFKGLKILMKEDDQVRENRFAEYIGNKKIDIVITCTLEALDCAGEDRRLQNFANRAYEEIAVDPDHRREHFVGKFDEVVERRLWRNARQRPELADRTGAPLGRPSGKALLLMAHEPTRDPRIDWFSEGLAADYEVCEIGICRPEDEATAPSLERLSARRIRVRVNGRRIQWDFATPGFGTSRKSSLGVDAMERLFIVAQLPLRSLGDAIGALDTTETDLGNFRWLCDYFVNINSALLDAARRIGGFDLVVAADLDTLPAGAALAEEYGVPLVYDAHEYWPYAFAKFRHWEIEFWCDLERALLQRVTLPLTVSPQLAAIMGKEYGCAFDCIPNCASKGSERAVDLEAALTIHARREEVIFLVQGGFGLQRGFEKLINVWGRVDPHAKLWLRGPDSPEKTAIIELAESKGLLNRRVFFPESVGEAELVAAARDADIGLVPYEPVSLNNRYCSPNKLSQYMAAGLPIICNELDFVKSVVVDNGVGMAVDFGDEAALVRTINEFVLNRESIPALSRKSQELFKSSFNWQAKSQNTYSSIRSIVTKNQPNQAKFDFCWIEDPDPPTPGLPATSDLSAQELLSNEIQRLNTVYTEEIKRLNEIYAADVARIIRRPVVGRLSYIFHRGARLFVTFLKRKPIAVAAYGRLRRVSTHFGSRRKL